MSADTNASPEEEAVATTPEEKMVLMKLVEPLEYYKTCFECGQRRGDERTLESFRPINSIDGVITSACGSVSLKMGNTVLICAAKAELAEPLVEAPDCGAVYIGIEAMNPELISDNSPIEEAKMILQDLVVPSVISQQRLSICKGLLCWVIYVDISIFNNDGGLVDACLTAMIATLKQVRLPTVEAKNSDEVLSLKNIRIKSEDRQPLQLNTLYPIASTFLLYKDKVVCDPTLEELNLFHCKMTIVTGANDVICGLFKLGGRETVKAHTLAQCTALAIKRRTEILNTLNIVDTSNELDSE
ncbi:Putative exosome complex exonuclease RRP43 [Trichuris trichiura]|uniref:Ribosomal RNA-processing protein 42 n=1 Tax=Trichuris trichiura TaxID=36087 RepID=A0A077Z9B3_TRITR|nr:Putative exosome complex exonuclease RRP43 [Trichuris trichiura]